MSGGLASLAACLVLAALFAANRGRGASSSAHRLVGASCAALMLVVGCGGEATPLTDSSRSTTAEQTTATVSAAARARKEARLQRRAQLELERTFAPNRWKRSGAVPPHPDQPLEHLIVREVQRGRGPPLRGDENVWVNFVKTYWRSGRVFLVAWGPLRADYFSLLAQSSGIRRGMVGMRPGGRRTIAIPERVADVHEPNHRGGMEAANIDVVLRGIVHPPAPGE